jgi:ATPase subunit of ABC transporter with duplicated ATPase domains
MRVALARILLMRPDVLLLDEPTNHLDIESILWLEGFLKGFEGALLMTSHDREFMNRIVNKIVEIDGGELTTYTGNYDFYERPARHRATQQEAQYARQQAMLAKEEAFIERFKARASHAAQVQSPREEARQDREGRAAQAPQRCSSTSASRRARARTWPSSRGQAKAYGSRTIYDDFDCSSAAASAGA